MLTSACISRGDISLSRGDLSLSLSWWPKPSYRGDLCLFFVVTSACLSWWRQLVFHDDLNLSPGVTSASVLPSRSTPRLAGWFWSKPSTSGSPPRKKLMEGRSGGLLSGVDAHSVWLRDISNSIISGGVPRTSQQASPNTTVLTHQQPGVSFRGQSTKDVRPPSADLWQQGQDAECVIRCPGNRALKPLATGQNASYIAPATQHLGLWQRGKMRHTLPREYST